MRFLFSSTLDDYLLIAWIAIYKYRYFQNRYSRAVFQGEFAMGTGKRTATV